MFQAPLGGGYLFFINVFIAIVGTLLDVVKRRFAKGENCGIVLGENTLPLRRVMSARKFYYSCILAYIIPAVIFLMVLSLSTRALYNLYSDTNKVTVIDVMLMGGDKLMYEVGVLKNLLSPNKEEDFRIPETLVSVVYSDEFLTARGEEFVRVN